MGLQVCAFLGCIIVFALRQSCRPSFSFLVGRAVGNIPYQLAALPHLSNVPNVPDVPDVPDVPSWTIGVFGREMWRLESHLRTCAGSARLAWRKAEYPRHCLIGHYHNRQDTGPSCSHVCHSAEWSPSSV